MQSMQNCSLLKVAKFAPEFIVIDSCIFEPYNCPAPNEVDIMSQRIFSWKYFRWMIMTGTVTELL